jgi:hypothetical protein
VSNRIADDGYPERTDGNEMLLVRGTPCDYGQREDRARPSLFWLALGTRVRALFTVDHAVGFCGGVALLAAIWLSTLFA